MKLGTLTDAQGGEMVIAAKRATATRTRTRQNCRILGDVVSTPTGALIPEGETLPTNDRRMLMPGERALPWSEAVRRPSCGGLPGGV